MTTTLIKCQCSQNSNSNNNFMQIEGSPRIDRPQSATTIPVDRRERGQTGRKFSYLEEIIGFPENRSFIRNQTYVIESLASSPSLRHPDWQNPKSPGVGFMEIVKKSFLSILIQLFTRSKNSCIDSRKLILWHKVIIPCSIFHATKSWLFSLDNISISSYLGKDLQHEVSALSPTNAPRSDPSNRLPPVCDQDRCWKTRQYRENEKG